MEDNNINLNKMKEAYEKLKKHRLKEYEEQMKEFKMLLEDLMMEQREQM